MKKRKYLNQANPSQNLDSFLDILTNTVGVLIFICLFVYLVAAQATTTIKTPVITKSDKQPRFFEVRNQKVNYVNQENIDLQIKKLVSSLPECYEPNIPEQISPSLYRHYSNQIEDYQACQKEQIEAVENFKASTKYYDVQLVGESLVYKPKDSIVGETPSRLNQANSEFQTILKDLDPETDFLAFVVKADSYEAFRVARQQAWDRGFDVGWEPQTVDTKLAFQVFGSGGRKINVQ
ncbi:hypothetical protein [Pleurocapsa sp. FMAR1]|uniref:hypothetical protein n=1 Tax=Pleurocapsa sp. FMAR1 TaxID=3040204 RepID=UPI0029C60DBB|nr:hypothetical protein [Pleurocapsa sp. FMAR1]